LDASEIGVFQVIFAPALSPWTRSIMRAVTNGNGESFFGDAPEMVKHAVDKTSRPLFGPSFGSVSRARLLAAPFR